MDWNPFPLFQFAIFYNEDLEMNPQPGDGGHGSACMQAGTVIFCRPILTFSNDVTSSGVITLNYKPGDPQGSAGSTFLRT